MQPIGSLLSSLRQRASRLLAPAGSVRAATPADLKFLKMLQQRDTDALGFMPGEAFTQYLARGAVTMIDENGDPAGYVLAAGHVANNPLVRPLYQCCIDFSLRRRHHGLQLVDTVINAAREDGIKVVKLWCASDLPANDFWRAAGFQPVAQRDGGKRRGRQHILWARTVEQLSAADYLLKPADSARGPGGRFSATPMQLQPLTVAA